MASPAKFWDFEGLNRPNDSIRAIFGKSNTGLNFSGKKLPILGFFCPYIFTDFQENSARPPVVFSGVLGVMALRHHPIFDRVHHQRDRRLPIVVHIRLLRALYAPSSVLLPRFLLYSVASECHRTPLLSFLS